MAKKTNPWLVHVKKVRAKNKGKSLKDHQRIGSLSN